MLEIGRFHAAIVECHAGAAALDALRIPADVHACRVAPDELLLLAAPARAAELLQRASAHLAVVEPGALVADQSDGWTIFSLAGDGGMSALAQLAQFPIRERRPAFLQGAVAGGAAKLLLLPGVVHILVPFALRDHVEGRLRDVCAARPFRLATSESPFAPIFEVAAGSPTGPSSGFPT
ncbi:MAG: hypothetical protein KBF21_12265 [Thermoanaerobaculia bacterium]|nr:hypothetical protein [Thermoanaerobaculia bacterium]MBP9824991.1 hypothetical protein [Thermoanaerobaculia bacterium]